MYDKMLDDIVIEELQDYYRLVNRFDRVDCSDTVIEPDIELLQALQIVLSNYMTKKEFAVWLEHNPIESTENG